MFGCFDLSKYGSNDLIYIYFITTDDGFVKIGKSNHPNKRFSDLQSANPHKLELNVCFIGDPFLEDLLHILYDKQHHRGEWFKNEGILKLFLENYQNVSLVINSLYFDIVNLPEVSYSSNHERSGDAFKSPTPLLKEAVGKDGV